MTTIDTHAHLNHPDFDADRSGALARAREAGVVAIINVGFDLPTSELAVELARRAPGCFASVGVHPHHADAYGAAQARLLELLTMPGVVALGETGLDFCRNLSPREAQLAAFRQQLALARERNLPVILHNRDAQQDMMAILRTDGIPERGGVVHCFPGDAEMARECVRLGLHIGVNGIITFGNADTLRQAVAAVPLERVLTETDCPWLPPAPRRGKGKRNEPAYIPYIVDELARVLERSPVEVAEVTTANARRLFGMP